MVPGRRCAQRCASSDIPLRCSVIGSSTIGQDALAINSIRQSRQSTALCTAGCHIAAWESPIRAIVVDDARLPVMHSGWLYGRDPQRGDDCRIHLPENVFHRSVEHLNGLAARGGRGVDDQGWRPPGRGRSGQVFPPTPPPRRRPPLRSRRRREQGCCVETGVVIEPGASARVQPADGHGTV